VLPGAVSRTLLESVRPVQVFSGDDHDICEVLHAYGVRGVQRVVPELTVGSMSWTMGVLNPSLAVLALSAASATDDDRHGVAPSSASEHARSPPPELPLCVDGNRAVAMACRPPSFQYSVRALALALALRCC
jgi:hypothetical protein